MLSHKMEGFGWYTYETISRIVKNHPEHQFVFFFDRPYDESFIFAGNVTPVILNPPARHPILFKIWFNYSVTRALKKYKCDAFISPDGYLSLKTNLPQLAVIHDLNFEHNPDDLPKSALNYLKKYFPKFARKANRICTVSNYSKQDIIDKYDVPSDKIDITYNGVSDIFKPLPEDEQAKIRKQFSEGNRYVLFVGAIHKRKNLQRLIKVFHRIKTETDLPHKLLIVGEPLWKSQKIEITENIKNSVKFTGHLSPDQLAGLMAAADVFAFVSYFEGFGIPLVEAMRSGTAVLSGNLTALPEVGGDAAHYCNPLDEEDIYQKLMELLTDERLRKKLIEKGLERSKMFSWDQTANDLWNSFIKMMH
ncbi:MAG: glycosyltransferase family 1 protein [Brumimicrobium sp.]|nr:glycosyltransferase family 1 protein [Brumimicrobium sp.]